MYVCGVGCSLIWTGSRWEISRHDWHCKWSSNNPSSLNRMVHWCSRTFELRTTAGVATIRRPWWLLDIDIVRLCSFAFWASLPQPEATVAVSRTAARWLSWASAPFWMQIGTPLICCSFNYSKVSSSFSAAALSLTPARSALPVCCAISLHVNSFFTMPLCIDQRCSTEWECN